MLRKLLIYSSWFSTWVLLLIMLISFPSVKSTTYTTCSPKDYNQDPANFLKCSKKSTTAQYSSNSIRDFCVIMQPLNPFPPPPLPTPASSNNTTLIENEYMPIPLEDFVYYGPRAGEVPPRPPPPPPSRKKRAVFPDEPEPPHYKILRQLGRLDAWSMQKYDDLPFSIGEITNEDHNRNWIRNYPENDAHNPYYVEVSRISVKKSTAQNVEPDILHGFLHFRIFMNRSDALGRDQPSRPAFLHKKFETPDNARGFISAALIMVKDQEGWPIGDFSIDIPCQKSCSNYPYETYYGDKTNAIPCSFTPPRATSHPGMFVFDAHPGFYYNDTFTKRRPGLFKTTTPEPDIFLIKTPPPTTPSPLVCECDNAKTCTAPTNKADAGDCDKWTCPTVQNPTLPCTKKVGRRKRNIPEKYRSMFGKHYFKAYNQKIQRSKREPAGPELNCTCSSDTTNIVKCQHETTTGELACTPPCAVTTDICERYVNGTKPPSCECVDDEGNIIGPCGNPSGPKNKTCDGDCSYITKLNTTCNYFSNRELVDEDIIAVGEDGNMGYEDGVPIYMNEEFRIPQESRHRGVREVHATWNFNQDSCQFASKLYIQTLILEEVRDPFVPEGSAKGDSSRPRIYGWSAQYNVLLPTKESLGAADYVDLEFLKERNLRKSEIDCHVQMFDTPNPKGKGFRKGPVPQRGDGQQSVPTQMAFLKSLSYLGSARTTNQPPEYFGQFRDEEQLCRFQAGAASGSDNSLNPVNPSQREVSPPKASKFFSEKRNKLERCPCPALPTPLPIENRTTDPNRLHGRLIHASHMTIAYMLLMPLACFVARFYKETFVTVFCFQEFWWFMWHVFFLMIACVFNVGAVLSISLNKKEPIPFSIDLLIHKILGGISIGVFYLSMITGFFRHSEPNKRKKQIFVHWLVGVLNNLCAIGSMFAMAWVKSSGFSCNVMYTLIGYLCFVTTFYIIMEISMRRGDKKLDLKPKRSYLPPPVVRLFHRDAPGQNFRMIMLLLFIVGLILFQIAISWFIWSSEGTCCIDELIELELEKQRISYQGNEPPAEQDKKNADDE